MIALTSFSWVILANREPDYVLRSYRELIASSMIPLIIACGMIDARKWGWLCICLVPIPILWESIPAYFQLGYWEAIAMFVLAASLPWLMVAGAWKDLQW